MAQIWKTFNLQCPVQLRPIIPGERYLVAFPFLIVCLKTPWKYVMWNLCENMYIYFRSRCCIHDVYQQGITGHANQWKLWPYCISAILPQTSKQWALSAPNIRIHGDGAKFKICTWQIWPSAEWKCGVGVSGAERLCLLFYIKKKKSLLRSCQNPTHNAAK